ncbi:hypothetical protein KFU94_62465 [Chloroflexi bacterium TSY]|nr:hypothetical protein [Chloroflexi bacterium TSY]
MIDLEKNHLLFSQVGLNWDISQLAALASLAGADVGLNSEELPIVFMDISTVNDSINEDILIDEPVPAMIFATQELIDLADLP